MKDPVVLRWINLIFSGLRNRRILLFIGLEQPVESHLRIPLKPYHDLVQTVMDVLGFTGEVPYMIIALVIALATLFILLNTIELIQKGLDRVKTLLGGEGRTGDYSEKQRRRELRRAQRNSDWKTAAECSEQLGKIPDAAKYYQMAGKFSKAGSLYERMKNYDKAVSCYASDRQYDKAAELLVKVKDYFSAAMMSEKSRNFIRAAVLFDTACKHEKAAAMLDMHFRGLSANTAPDLDLLRRSAEIYEKAGIPEKAAGYYLQTGSLQKAAELYENMGKKAEAAELFSKTRDFERAARLFEEIGEHKKSGEIRGMMFSMSGDYAAAAEKYLQAEDYFRAAESFHAAGQYQKAAETYQKAGYNAEAAESYARAEQWFKSAEIYEKSGNLEAAAAIYEKQYDLPKAIDCYRSAKQYFRTGHILMKMELCDEALEMFDLVDKEDPYFMLSQVETGVCLFKMNNPQEAGDILEKALADLNPDADTKESFYTLGLIYERSGRRNEARKIYNRILAEDESYLDIKERLQKISTSITDPSDLPADRTIRLTEVVSKIEQRYDIIRELGRGGMGVVFQARDKLLDRDVALKQLSPSVFNEEEAHSRFLREARAASRLNHSNIVSVYDVIEDRNALFIAMEYIDGINLHQYMEKHPSLPFKLVLAVAGQVADALKSAHDKGVIHRDIKPDNIMITNKGKVKITDFGIAHMTESKLTTTGIVIGTMKYMSPEQIKGEKVTAASDLYSFGVVLYEMVTGSPPFEKGDMTYHHVHTSPIPPRQVNHEIPESFEKIILKCLAKDPAKRYANAHDLLLDLKTVREAL
jgi:tetratricopeptide (TPR) repeat protein